MKKELFIYYFRIICCLFNFVFYTEILEFTNSTILILILNFEIHILS